MLGFSKKLVFPAQEFKRNPPENLASANVEHFSLNHEYRCPPLFVYRFRSVTMLPDSTLFLFRFLPLPLSFPFFKSRMRHHSVKGVIDLQRNWQQMNLVDERTTYLAIHDQWSSNYYHWLTQALPRLLMAFQTTKSFTLILPENHTSEFHIKSLQLLGVTEWINVPAGQTYYRIKNLIYPSHDIQIGDYHDELIRQLAMRLNKNNGSGKRRRIFVHRTSTTGRRIINEDAVIAAFVSWGFAIVRFENLSFNEQMNLAANACVLAGVHGAGLTNMLFMEKGSSVFELTSRLNGEQYYYFTLSNALQHHYFYQVCTPDDADKSVQDANLIVDVELLHRNLEQLVKTHP
jgi:hypothetical protein